MLIAHDVARHRKSGFHDHLGIDLGSFEQRSKVGVLLVILISLLSPRRNSFTVKDEHVKKGVRSKIVSGLMLVASKSTGTGGGEFEREYDKSAG